MPGAAGGRRRKSDKDRAKYIVGMVCMYLQEWGVLNPSRDRSKSEGEKDIGRGAGGRRRAAKEIR